MEKGRESDAKYKRLNIHKKTSKEVDREMCGTIQDRESSVEECGKVEATGLNEDSPSSKY